MMETLGIFGMVLGLACLCFAAGGAFFSNKL